MQSSRCLRQRWLVAAVATLLPAVAAAAIFDSDGVPIWYEEHGAGEPVVLLHGFSQTLEMWEETGLLGALADKYRVIAVDLRGHGRSGKPHHPEAYGAEMGADIVRLLDHLGIGEAHLIGFSMGATVIGGLLTTDPSRVSTATLGSGFFSRWDEKEEEFARFTESRANTGERYPWEPENQDFDALAAVIRGFRHMDVADEEVAAITTPTVVVFGSLELQRSSEEDLRRFHSLPSSVRTIVIEGADHDRDRPAILEPEFLNAAIDLIEGR